MGLLAGSACSSSSNTNAELLKDLKEIQAQLDDTQEQLADLSKSPPSPPEENSSERLESTVGSPPEEEPAPSEEPESVSSATPEPTATPEIPEGSNIIVAAQGVLGWSIAGEWIDVGDPPVDPASIPAEEGDLYRVLRAGSPTNIGVSGSEPIEGCGALPGYTVEIEIDDPMFNADGWPYTYPIAISANWDLAPQDIEFLNLESEVYKAFASDLLAEIGIVEPDPNLITLIRTDLEGDGVDEVIVGAERISGPLISPSVGDYSILFIRKIVGGDVTQQIIASDFHSGEEFTTLTSGRLIAIADLNGDSQMEIVLQQAYYEGSATSILEYKNDVEGLQVVLSVGCGA